MQKLLTDEIGAAQAAKYKLTDEYWMVRKHGLNIIEALEDWAKQIDTILMAGGNDVLQTSGSVSAQEAKEHAETEYEKFRVIQDRMFISDFDKYLGKLPFEDETN